MEDRTQGERCKGKVDGIRSNTRRDRMDPGNIRSIFIFRKCGAISTLTRGSYIGRVNGYHRGYDGHWEEGSRGFYLDRLIGKRFFEMDIKVNMKMGKKSMNIYTSS